MPYDPNKKPESALARYLESKNIQFNRNKDLVTWTTQESRKLDNSIKTMLGAKLDLFEIKSKLNSNIPCNLHYFSFVKNKLDQRINKVQNQLFKQNPKSFYTRVKTGMLPTNYYLEENEPIPEYQPRNFENELECCEFNRKLLVEIKDQLEILNNSSIGGRSRKGSSPIRKGSSPIRKGSSPIRKGSSPTRKGSTTTRKGSSPISKGSSPIRKRSSPIRKRSSPTRKGSSKRKGSSPTRKGSTTTRKGSSPIRKGSSPIRKGSFPKGSSRVRKSSPKRSTKEQSSPQRQNNSDEQNASKTFAKQAKQISPTPSPSPLKKTNKKKRKIIDDDTSPVQPESSSAPDPSKQYSSRSPKQPSAVEPKRLSVTGDLKLLSPNKNLQEIQDEAYIDDQEEEEVDDQEEEVDDQTEEEVDEEAEEEEVDDEAEEVDDEAEEEVDDEEYPTPRGLENTPPEEEEEYESPLGINKTGDMIPLTYEANGPKYMYISPAKNLTPRGNYDGSIFLPQFRKKK